MVGAIARGPPKEQVNQKVIGQFSVHLQPPFGANILPQRPGSSESRLALNNPLIQVAALFAEKCSHVYDDPRLATQTPHDSNEDKHTNINSRIDADIERWRDSENRINFSACGQAKKGRESKRTDWYRARELGRELDTQLAYYWSAGS